MSDEHDELLLREFQSGDEGAFDRLVRRHQDVIYRLALRHLGDANQAAEAAQEVCIRAWKKLPDWRPGGGKVFTWLYRTTTFVCREFRRDRHRLHLSSSVDPCGETPDRSDPAAEDREARMERLEALVTSLPPRQQDVIWLHAYEGLALKDVAATLNIPLGTVKSNYHKALCSLRERWSTAPDVEEPATAAGGAP